jgi:hypothetical protein
MKRSTKSAEPEPKRKSLTLGQGAILDDPPIHIRPIIPASAGAKDKTCGFKPLRHAEHRTTMPQPRSCAFWPSDVTALIFGL